MKKRKTTSLILILLLIAAVGYLMFSQDAGSLPDLPVVESQEQLPINENTDADPSPGTAPEAAGDTAVSPPGDAENASAVVEGERYTSPEQVAAYLHEFGDLPPNFITKNAAGELGWESSEGNLWEVTDEMSIGGDRFGNREGLLPEADGRKYYECDVNYQGGYREAERLVYSNDGLIFYTNDHYETFSQLY